MPKFLRRFTSQFINLLSMMKLYLITIIISTIFNFSPKEKADIKKDSIFLRTKNPPIITNERLLQPSEYPYPGTIQLISRYEKKIESPFLNPSSIFQILYMSYKKKELLNVALSYYDQYLKEKNLIYPHTVLNETYSLTYKKLKLKSDVSKSNQSYFIAIIIILFSLLTLAIFLYLNYTYKQKFESLKAKVYKNKENLKAQYTENLFQEIRTTVTVALSYLKLMDGHILNPKKLKKYIDESINNNHVILKKADEFLTVLKLESNEINDNIQEKNMVNFFKAKITSFSEIANLKKIKLFYSSNIEYDLFVSFDYEKLAMIISNLITNSIRYSYENTSIYVKVYYTNNNLKISVKDEGIGISKDKQELIFTRFNRSNDINNFGIYGIGLSLVKGLVEYLNGEIILKSEINKGTLFIVNIPIKFTNFDKNLFIKKPEFTCVNEENDNKLPSQDKDLPKVLIVDHNINLVKCLKEGLRSFLNCHIALNGNEALNKLADNSYQIIIAGLKMPLMSGVEFKRRLNLEPAFKEIPFLMLTPKSYSNFKDLGLSIGISDYLFIPFKVNELISRIKNLLENHSFRLKSSQMYDIEPEFTDLGGVFDNLINNVVSIIEKNIDNPEFSVQLLADSCNYSQRQLSRVLKSKTGLTPVNVILEVRLQKAYSLIKNREHNSIKEVIYAIGLNNRSYFNKKFKERFGIHPSKLNS